MLTIPHRPLLLWIGERRAASGKDQRPWKMRPKLKSEQSGWRQSKVKISRRRGVAPAADRSSDDEEELEGREQRPGPRRHDGEN